MSTNSHHHHQVEKEMKIINPNVVSRENAIRKELALNVLSKCQTFMDRILPSSVDREVNEWRQKIIAQEAQHSIEVSDMLHVFRTKFLKEIANKALASGSIIARFDFAEKFASCTKELAQSTSTEIHELTKCYDNLVKEAANIEDDFARETHLEVQQMIFNGAVESFLFSLEQFRKISKNLME